MILVFAPFPYEDSDIFQRWILSGYELVQSRDALVYHLTCRGHRWNKEVGKNDDEFKTFEFNARKHYLKKWGSWIKNNEFGHPVLSPVYRKKIIINNENTNLISLYDWFNEGEDIVVTIDGNTFTQQDFQYITQLNDIISDSGEVGEFKLGNIQIKINKIEDISSQLIKV